MGLSRKFFDAGVERRTPPQARQVNRSEASFLQANAISLKSLSSGIPCNKPNPKHVRRDRCPRSDARDFCEKFKAIVWGNGVHLDNVCISELGSEDILENGQCIGNRYHDIASVPLPGVTWKPRSFEYLRIPHRWATAETRAD